VNVQQGDVEDLPVSPLLCHCFCQALHPDTATTMTCTNEAKLPVPVIMHDKLAGLTQTQMCKTCADISVAAAPAPDPAIARKLSELEADLHEQDKEWNFPPVFMLWTKNGVIPLMFSEEIYESHGGHPVPLLGLIGKQWSSFCGQTGTNPAEIGAVICLFNTWFLLPKTEADEENFREIQARGRVWAHPDREELRIGAAWQRDGGCATIARIRGREPGESEAPFGDIAFALAKFMEVIKGGSPI
jgi:hypothetical protein